MSYITTMLLAAALGCLVPPASGISCRWRVSYLENDTSYILAARQREGVFNEVQTKLAEPPTRSLVRV